MFGSNEGSMGEQMSENEIGFRFELDATIRIYASARDALPRGPFDGMQPSFNFGRYLAACRVHLWEGESMPFDTDTEVGIEVAYSVAVHRELEEGSRFQLNFGGTVLGHGTVSAIRRPGR